MLRAAERIANTGSPSPAHIVNQLRAALEAGRALHSLAALFLNCVGADLRELDDWRLISLDGIRWSKETQWPPGRKEWVDRHSHGEGRVKVIWDIPGVLAG
ncbi:hypothetical protein GCM10027456_38260 [Kineosporia babensis]